MSNFSNLTDKTDKAYKVDIDNISFLNEIYRGRADDARGMYVSSAGNPNDTSSFSWAAQPFSTETIINKNNNNYFSLSSYTPNENGEFKRQKKHFSALHVIVLDDVGTKVALDEITLEPSYKIETSQNNFQYGYILKDSITDRKIADQLMKAIIDKGLSDSGAGGPTARLARLPVAINGKHDPSFECRLTHWNKELKYIIEDLVSGFSLDLTKAGKKRKQSKNFNGDEVLYIPKADENPVISALHQKGLYKECLGDGKHDITCPWVKEHTDEIDSGGAYFEPSDLSPIGGFKCHHGHCSDRNIRNLLEYLGIDPNLAMMKPVIRVMGGEIHKTVVLAEKELANTGKYYQRGNQIVSIVMDKTTKQTVVREIKPAALVPALSECSVWEQFDGRSKKVEKKDPPPKVIAALNDATSYEYLPNLITLAPQPYLSSNGKIINKSGYCSETQIYSTYKDTAYNIPEKPSKEDAYQASEDLKRLIAEFPFADDIDESATLSAMLAATIRSGLSLCPMYHVRAPQISSGKSYLCQLVSLFATPSNPTSATFPQNDEECRKQVLSLLLKCPSIIIFDNLTYDIVNHDVLCKILTQETHDDRILGVSKMITVNTRTLFLSNGNNVSPIHDMIRRCCVINLDPACEIPATRNFKHPDLLGYISKNRVKYISAALTIIQAWIAAGKPKTQCKTLASYQEWSDYCRQPLLWLGLPDPAEKMFKAMSEDPERDQLGLVLHVWHGQFGTTPMRVRDISIVLDKTVDGSMAINEMSDEEKIQQEELEEFSEAIRDIASDNGKINNMRLGYWVKRNEGKLVNGYKFVRDTTRLSSNKWKVEKLKSRVYRLYRLFLQGEKK